MRKKARQQNPDPSHDSAPLTCIILPAFVEGALSFRGVLYKHIFHGESEKLPIQCYEPTTTLANLNTRLNETNKIGIC